MMKYSLCKILITTKFLFYSRSKICLSKYINIEYDGDDFLDELCHYFARLIFSVVAKGLEEEIPLDLIKEAIIHV